MEVIKKYFNNLPEYKFSVLLLGGVFVYHILIGLQGLSIIDEGWELCGFQQILSHPESVETMFYFYNTLLLGGVWYKLFGVFGIIGFRILSALILTAITGFVYYLCRKINIDRKVLLFSLLITLLARGYVRVLHYDYTSPFVYLVAIVIISKALEKRNASLILCAGIVIGVGVFFRFPSVCFVCLIVLLLFLKSFKERLVFGTMAIGGFTIGVLLNILILYMLGHLDYMLNMLTVTFSLSTDQNSSHNILSLATLYFNQYREIFSLMGQFVFILGILFLIYKSKMSRYLKMTWIGCLCVGIVFFFPVWFFINHTITYMVIFTSYAFCFLVFLLCFVHRNVFDDPSLFLVVSSILMLVLVPLGSDGGIHFVGLSALYLPLPVAVGLLDKYIAAIYPNKHTMFRTAGTFLFPCFIGFFLTITSQTCFEDPGSRLKKMTRLKNSAETTTFTSYSRAQRIDALLYQLKHVVNAETEMLAYPNLPLINYLTATKPYLNAPWAQILTTSVFETKLESAETYKKLPVIVLSKSDILHLNPNPQWRNVRDCETSKTMNTLLEDFMKRHNYHVYYEDDIFQVLLPDIQ